MLLIPDTRRDQLARARAHTLTSRELREPALGGRPSLGLAGVMTMDLRGEETLEELEVRERRPPNVEEDEERARPPPRDLITGGVCCLDN